MMLPLKTDKVPERFLTKKFWIKSELTYFFGFRRDVIMRRTGEKVATIRYIDSRSMNVLYIGRKRLSLKDMSIILEVAYKTYPTKKEAMKAFNDVNVIW